MAESSQFDQLDSKSQKPAVVERGGINSVNTTKSKSIEIKLPGGIKETQVNDKLKRRAIKEGRSVKEILKETQEDMPPGVSLWEALKKNDIDEIADSAKDLKKTLGPFYKGLSGGDIDFLINAKGNLTKKILNKSDRLTRADLKDANGTDYAILGAIAVWQVAKVIQGGGNTSDVFKMLAGSALPSMFQSAALSLIVDVAGDYGLADVVSALIDVIKDEFKTKKKPTIRKLLSGFRFSTKPVIDELSTNQTKLLTSVGEYLGASTKDAEKITSAVKGYTRKTSYPTKTEQSFGLIHALDKIDKNWWRATRDGKEVQKLDNFQYCSKDAREAMVLAGLAKDEYRKFLIMSVIQKDGGYEPRGWYEECSSYYIGIYK